MNISAVFHHFCRSVCAVILPNVTCAGRCICKVMLECSQEFVRNHRQFVDNYPSQELIPSIQDVDIRVIQSHRSTPDYADVSSGMNGGSFHDMSHSYLESSEQKFFIVLSSHRPHEQATYPLDHSSFACPRRSVYES